MRYRGVYHESSLVIRFTGPHEGLVEIVGNLVQVLIPGAVITLADHKAAQALASAWLEARITGRRIMTSDALAAPYRHSQQVVRSAVRIGGEQPAPMVLGKAPRQSPSGCGQIVVRVGRLTMVCDDRGALDAQCRIWRQMYERAAEIWSIWPLSIWEPFTEEKIQDRLNRQGLD